MNAQGHTAPMHRPAVDLDETRRRFLLAREQIAAHAPNFSRRERNGWPVAADAPRLPRR